MYKVWEAGFSIYVLEFIVGIFLSALAKFGSHEAKSDSQMLQLSAIVWI